MDERSPEERVTASPLVVTLAGHAHSLRILNRREEREWRAVLQSKTGLLFASMDNIESRLASGGIFNLASDGILELVMAYDLDHVLGSTEADFDEVSNYDIYAALRAVLGVVFPFVGDLGALAQLGLLAPSPSVSSSNGRSTTGPVSATPGRSTKRSRPSS